MKLLRIDTETCGFIGPIVLIQYQYEGGPVQLYHVWDHPVGETLDLVESFLEHHVVFYNASFDAFHLSKLYNTFRLLEDINAQPHMNEVWEAEHFAHQGPCLRPVKCSDLYLLILEHGLSFLHKRKTITIRKVPLAAVPWLTKNLVGLKALLHPMLFKHQEPVWRIVASRQKGFVDYNLDFKPRAKMKMVIGHLFGTDMMEYQLPDRHVPQERMWRPWGGNWREVLFHHTRWWKNEGKSYAIQDVYCLTMIEKWLAGKTNIKMQPDRVWDVSTQTHTNSELAWAVGVCRQRGYPIDLDYVQNLIHALKTKGDPPTGGAKCLFYLREVCDPAMAEVLRSGKQDKYVLTQLIEMFPDSPVAFRAQKVLDTRNKKEKMEILERLEEVGRFHPDFKVGGTFSNRMSGGSTEGSEGGINPQGIMKDTFIRSCFTLHSPIVGEVLSGGDFSAQEVTILIAVIGSKALEDMTRRGIKIHRLLTSFCHDIPIEEVNEESLEYSKCKNGIFAFFYGAQWPRLAKTIYDLNDDTHIRKVKEAFDKLQQMIPEMRLLGERMRSDFCSMVQDPETRRVIWKESKSYVESIFGFRRYFDVENTVAKYIFGLAQRAGLEMRDIKGMIQRRHWSSASQTVGGATSSALYAAAFGIQERNLRAAGNHIIQSPGATITKALQSVLWSLQPIGINEWFVQPLNIHDEVLTPTLVPKECEIVVEATVEALRKQVPLLAIKWKPSVNNWAEIKG